MSTMTAHLDEVTSLAIDPTGKYLLSGSKYKPDILKSIRDIDLEIRN